MKDLFRTYSIYSTSDLRKHYESHPKNKNRAFWFSKGALAFFNSKIDEQVYCDNEHFYFVSSEKGPNEIRAYSIRSYNPVTGEIDTVGTFQAYKSMTQAKSAIKKLNPEIRK